MSELANISVLDRVANLEKQSKHLHDRFEGFLSGIQQFFKNYEEQRGYLFKVCAALAQTVNNMALLSTSDGSLYQKLSENVKTPIAFAENIIQEQIDKNEIEEAKATQSAQEKTIAQLLVEGKIYPVEKVTERSIIVGRKLDKEGNEFEANRLQFEFNGILAEYREKFIDQKVDAIIEDPDGSKVKITELYEMNLSKFQTSDNNNSSQNLPN